MQIPPRKEMQFDFHGNHNNCKNEKKKQLQLLLKMISRNKQGRYSYL